MSDASANLYEEWIFTGLFSDRKVGSIGFHETGRLQSFPHAALVIVDRGEVAVGGDFIQEERHGFPSPLKAAIEFGIGFREGSCVKICSAQPETADPGVEHGICFCESFQSLTRLFFCQGNLSLNQFPKGLRLRL